MVARYDPFADMIPIRELMNRLLESSVVRPSGILGSFATAVPFNLAESGQDVLVWAALPGADTHTLQLTIDQGVLTVRGQRSIPGAGGDGQQEYVWHVQGLPGGEFQFSVTLPAEVNADAAEASYDNGLLHIRLPKAEAAKTKRIAIRSGPTAQQPQLTGAR